MLNYDACGLWGVLLWSLITLTTVGLGLLQQK